MSRKLRIFAVDDEKIIANTLGIILNQNGYEAEVFHDGAAALAAAEERVPDLLLSDVLMPGLSGIDLAMQIQKRHPLAKVLLMSGNTRASEMLEEAKEQGYTLECLGKPIHPSDLLRHIEGMFA